MKPATARGTIVALGLKRFRGGSKSVFEIILDDGSARLHCRWWNLPFMQNYFAMGDEVFVFGKLSETKPRTMDHPETEVIEGGEESFIHINRIAPVYPLTEGLPQRWLRGLIWRTLEKFERHIAEPWPSLTCCRHPVGSSEISSSGKMPEARCFLPRANAIHMMHFPEELTDVEIARRRLALDEFIELQRQIQSRRKNFEAQRESIALRRRQSSDETVSCAAWLQADGGANESAARNPRGHGRRASDAAVVARRCRFRQNGRGGVLGVDGVGKRLQRGADGPDGNSGGTAFPEFYKLV